MLAHIVGVPIEEALPWMVPIGGLSLAGTLALMRSYAFGERRRERRAGVGGRPA